MRAFILSPIVLILTFVACGGDSTAPPHVSLEGDWFAVSVNGASLPASYVTGNLSTRVIERRLALSGDVGTWKDSTEIRVNGFLHFMPPVLPISWAKAGTQVTVTGTSAGWSDFRMSFSVAADALVNIDADGKTVIYRRR